MFTGSWLLLGLGHQGYSHVEGSISVLAAPGAPGAWVMTVAFVVQAAAMAQAGWLLRVVNRPAAAALAVNALATLVVAAARIGCGPEDSPWCAPGVHPVSERVHVAAATVALILLTVAPVLYGLRPPRSWVAVGCFAVMAPLLVWFAIDGGAGWAEKVVVTVGIWWAGLVVQQTLRQPAE